MNFHERQIITQNDNFRHTRLINDRVYGNLLSQGEKNSLNSCADLEIISNNTRGRFDGILTIFQNNIVNGVKKIDIFFDEKSLAFGVRNF